MDFSQTTCLIRSHNCSGRGCNDSSCLLFQQTRPVHANFGEFGMVRPQRRFENRSRTLVQSFCFLVSALRGEEVNIVCHVQSLILILPAGGIRIDRVECYCLPKQKQSIGKSSFTSSLNVACLKYTPKYTTSLISCLRKIRPKQLSGDRAGLSPVSTTILPGC